MNALVRHRGPDDESYFNTDPKPGHVSVGFGFRRLSIIDLSGGRQPMHTEDGNLSVTFNGEIFNYLELRETLQGEGHHFRTRSDTEVILAAVGPRVHTLNEDQPRLAQRVQCTFYTANADAIGSPE